ncbi:hypothetical protein BJ944DRAFT_241096 [Cunninghamella echinulata]|nr:hypothetical protein BJ944DRAFT_241096 [Cunninghamella echinulata]
MDDIVQCYKGEKIQPCLRTEELIAYHIRMGNDDIIKDMNVDVYTMLSVANQISCITRDEQIRLFYLRNKNSQHDNLCTPRMALKLELWDETLRPELFRAVSEKDYVTVNKFIHDEHVGITSGVIKDLKEAGYIPKSKEKTSNDDKELDNRQWFINHLSNHPEIEIVEKTIGGLSMIDTYRYEGDEYISGHSINTIDTYVDEDNPGDIDDIGSNLGNMD